MPTLTSQLSSNPHLSVCYLLYLNRKDLQWDLKRKHLTRYHDIAQYLKDILISFLQQTLISISLSWTSSTQFSHNYSHPPQTSSTLPFCHQSPGHLALLVIAVIVTVDTNSSAYVGVSVCAGGAEKFGGAGDDSRSKKAQLTYQMLLLYHQLPIPAMLPFSLNKPAYFALKHINLFNQQNTTTPFLTQFLCCLYFGVIL